MPRRCSVFGCRSNYDTEKEMFTTFSIPKEEPLRSKWLRKIPTDFSKLKNPAVCLKHFEESSIIRSDVVIYKGEKKEYPRKIPKLVEGTVPTLFPNAPKYLSVPQSSSKRLPDVEEEQYQNAINESLKDAQEYIKKDTINNILDISQYILSKNTLQNWICQSKSDFLLLRYIDSSNPLADILATIFIEKSLNVSVYIKSCKIENSKLPGNIQQLKSFNHLDNLINFIEKEVSEPNPKIDNVNLAIMLIMQHVDYEESNYLKFFVEQLKLFQVPKEGRRFNNNTMIFSSTLYVYSPSAYNMVRKSGLLLMPNPRNLQKLISVFNLNNTNFDNSVKYLKTRLKYLKDHEKVVNLHLDEIYIQPEINFKGTSVYGVNAFNSSECAKTAQVFMISSILSKYRDVVSIMPINNLQSEQLHKMTLSVLSGLESIGFSVIALISDNNAVNRKTFELFSEDKTLKPCVPHPLDSSRLLFFIFDTVHIIKCIRNNWESKKNSDRCMIFPKFDDDSANLNASYKDLELLYHAEKKSLVKYGNLLSYKVLYPSNVQKQNVSLALKLFSEKNIAALELASEDKLTTFISVEGTIEFLKIFVNWWKTVNVKSVFEGKRFNDTQRESIKSKDDDQMIYLRKMTNWLKKWKTSIPTVCALTFQTSTAIIHTNEAFLQLVPYLFENYKLDYILLSKFQNDTIESRFSTYRQLSGSNYFISFIQLLENERKIRFKNFVLLATENINIKFKTMLPVEEVCNTHDECNINQYIEILNVNFVYNDVPSNILKILVFIGGYSVKVISNRNHCEFCLSWLQLNSEMEIENLGDEYKYVENLNRGSLKLPTHYVVTATCIAWFVMKKILEAFRSQFMQDDKQLTILHKLSCIFISREDRFPLKELCLCNVTLFNKLELVTLTACKIMLNNFVKSIKDDLQASRKNTLDKRKVKKLKSA